MGSKTRLLAYVVAAVAACAVVLVLVRLTDNPAWGALPAVFYAAYLSLTRRRLGCERRDDA